MPPGEEFTLENGPSEPCRVEKRPVSPGVSSNRAFSWRSAPFLKGHAEACQERSSTPSQAPPHPSVPPPKRRSHSRRSSISCQEEKRACPQSPPLPRSEAVPPIVQLRLAPFFLLPPANASETKP